MWIVIASGLQSTSLGFVHRRSLFKTVAIKLSIKYFKRLEISY